MKKIIALKGRSKSGKSTALTNAVDEIFEVKIYKPKIQRDLVFSFKYKSKTIAIITVGDTVPQIERYFNKIKDKFDILICACRDSGATFNFYNGFSRIDGYSVLFIDKRENTDSDRGRVISEIKEMIFNEFNE